MFRPEPAVEESYELLRDRVYNLAAPPRTLLSYVVILYHGMSYGIYYGRY